MFIINLRYLYMFSLATYVLDPSGKDNELKVSGSLMKNVIKLLNNKHSCRVLFDLFQ